MYSWLLHAHPRAQVSLSRLQPQSLWERLYFVEIVVEPMTLVTTTAQTQSL